MADLIWIHNWIKIKQNDNPNWKIPDNTEDFLNGIENDMESLSHQLGVDLSLYAIIPNKKFKP